VALCTRTGDQDSPTIISDGAGGAIVTWYDYRSGAPDIYAQRVNSKGAVLWTTDGVPLCTAANYQTLPTIVSDDAGGAIVTWGDVRSGNSHIYAQRVNASGVVQWTANGVALCTAMGDQWVPTIVPDGAGGAIVTWYDVRSGNSDIYAQRVSALGVVQWAANGVPLCTATGDQSYPQIISDGAGGAIITWMDDRSGNSDIYALRIDANGSTGVTASDAPAVPIELQQNYPNPFNPTTTVAYSVPERCNVALKIYDVSGKCVARLVDKEQEKGSYTVAWNGKDETGNSMASGIYLYRLSAGNQTIAKKMVLLR
jgi:predicted lipoprotein with Yx(FWY)xxD motif